MDKNCLEYSLSICVGIARIISVPWTHKIMEGVFVFSSSFSSFSFSFSFSSSFVCCGDGGDRSKNIPVLWMLGL